MLGEMPNGSLPRRPKDSCCRSSLKVLDSLIVFNSF
uniref:Uncharacterized protein n=1 Tax=Arundo donax TaxID=35708 RepID=A0A0A9BGX6_ARUDO